MPPLDGWFITWAGDEKAEVENLLREEGYEESPAGLRKFLIDMCDNPPEEDIRDEVNPLTSVAIAWIRNNPDKVSGAIDKAGDLVRRLMPDKKG